jgi:hypothetical protein
MSTLWTVKDVNGTPTEVQSTLDDFKTDLADQLISVYVYVGAPTDDGWIVAKTACALYAGTNPWLFEDIADLRPWLPTGSPAGIAFGYDDTPGALLDATAATDLTKVRKAIRARS